MQVKSTIMDEKSTEPTPQRPAGDRIIDAPLVEINLPLLIKQIKEEEAWQKSDRNAVTVYKTNGMRIVLIALHKGAEMKQHKAAGVISVQVIEGKIVFCPGEKNVELGKGQMLALHQGILHSVLAKEETIFLLTLNTVLP